MSSLVFFVIFSVLLISTYLILIYITNNYMNYKVLCGVGILFIAVVSILAYYTVPLSDDDLYRYYGEINRMREYGWHYIINDSTYKINIISNMLLYIVSLTKNNSMLPYITLLIDILCVEYIIKQEIKKNNISPRVLVWNIFIYLGICALYVSISGIRFMLGVSLAAVIVYKDKIEKKNYIELMYIILPFIHTSLIVVFVYKLLTKRIKKIYKYTYIIMFWPIVMPLILKIISLFPFNIFKSVEEKIIMYSTYNSLEGSQIRMLGYVIFSIALIFMLETINASMKKNKDNEIKEYFHFTRTLFYIILGSLLVVPSTYFRFLSIIVILLIPLWKIFFNIKDNIKKASVLGLYISSISIFYIYQYLLYIRTWQIKIF